MGWRQTSEGIFLIIIDVGGPHCSPGVYKKVTEKVTRSKQVQSTPPQQLHQLLP